MQIPGYILTDNERRPWRRGGMACLYRARPLSGEPGDVVVKVLHKELLANPAAVRSFRQEYKYAKAIGRFNDRLASARDYGTLPDGRPYFVMDLLRGEDCRHLIQRAARKRKKLSLRLVCRVGEETAALLHVLTDILGHTIIHRDVAPDNIILGMGGNGVYLLDFGVATGLEQGIEGAGKPAYLAPEPAQNVSPATDVYSLGCTLFHMLTGRLPYPVDARDVAGARVAHQRGDVPDVRAYRPDAPAWLADLIRRMMARNPAQRPSADDVRSALYQGRHLAASHDDVDIDIPIDAGREEDVDEPGGRGRKVPVGLLLLIAAGGLMLLVLLGVIGLLVWIVGPPRTNPRISYTRYERVDGQGLSYPRVSLEVSPPEAFLYYDNKRLRPRGRSQRSASYRHDQSWGVPYVYEARHGDKTASRTVQVPIPVQVGCALFTNQVSLIVDVPRGIECLGSEHGGTELVVTRQDADSDLNRFSVQAKWGLIGGISLSSDGNSYAFDFALPSLRSQDLSDFGLKTRSRAGGKIELTTIDADKQIEIVREELKPLHAQFVQDGGLPPKVSSSWARVSHDPLPAWFGPPPPIAVALEVVAPAQRSHGALPAGPACRMVNGASGENVTHYRADERSRFVEYPGDNEPLACLWGDTIEYVARRGTLSTNKTLTLTADPLSLLGLSELGTNYDAIQARIGAWRDFLVQDYLDKAKQFADEHAPFKSKLQIHDSNEPGPPQVVATVADDEQLSIQGLTNAAQNGDVIRLEGKRFGDTVNYSVIRGNGRVSLSLLLLPDKAVAEFTGVAEIENYQEAVDRYEAWKDYLDEEPAGVLREHLTQPKARVEVIAPGDYAKATPPQVRLNPPLEQGESVTLANARLTGDPTELADVKYGERLDYELKNAHGREFRESIIILPTTDAATFAASVLEQVKTFGEASKRVDAWSELSEDKVDQALRALLAQKNPVYPLESLVSVEPPPDNPTGKPFRPTIRAERSPGETLALAGMPIQGDRYTLQNAKWGDKLSYTVRRTVGEATEEKERSVTLAPPADETVQEWTGVNRITDPGRLQGQPDSWRDYLSDKLFSQLEEYVHSPDAYLVVHVNRGAGDDPFRPWCAVASKDAQIVSFGRNDAQTGWPTGAEKVELKDFKWGEDLSYEVRNSGGREVTKRLSLTPPRGLKSLIGLDHDEYDYRTAKGRIDAWIESGYLSPVLSNELENQKHEILSETDLSTTLDVVLKSVTRPIEAGPPQLVLTKGEDERVSVRVGEAWVAFDELRTHNQLRWGQKLEWKVVRGQKELGKSATLTLMPHDQDVLALTGVENAQQISEKIRRCSRWRPYLVESLAKELQAHVDAEIKAAVPAAMLNKEHALSLLVQGGGTATDATDLMTSARSLLQAAWEVQKVSIPETDPAATKLATLWNLCGVAGDKTKVTAQELIADCLKRRCEALAESPQQAEPGAVQALLKVLDQWAREGVLERTDKHVSNSLGKLANALGMEVIPEDQGLGWAVLDTFPDLRQALIAKALQAPVARALRLAESNASGAPWIHVGNELYDVSQELNQILPTPPEKERAYVYALVCFYLGGRGLRQTLSDRPDLQEHLSHRLIEALRSSYSGHSLDTADNFCRGKIIKSIELQRGFTGD